MGRSKRRKVIVIIALALTACAGWLALPSRRAADLRVTTAPITAGAIVRHVIVSGTLMPVSTVDVGTQVSGTVQSIDADFNSVVRQGQVLLRLDDGTYRAALAEARAAQRRAEADAGLAQTAVDEASRNLSRADDLAARNILARSDLEVAQTAMAQAEADAQAAVAVVEQAVAAVHEARVNLDLTVIRSPVSGVVVDREVDAGVTVAAMQSPVLFRLATDFTLMEVQANVDEADIAGIRSGQIATFDVSAYPGQVFKGRVADVRLDALRQTPGADPSTARPAVYGDTAPAVVSYPVIITVENADEKLRPGMTAVVSLEGPRRDQVARIPNNALIFTPTPQVLEAAGITAAAASAGIQPDPSAHAANEGLTRTARVWEYDGSEFTPVAVETGLSDDSWTELIKGPIGPGIALVTNAQLAH